MLSAPEPHDLVCPGFSLPSAEPGVRLVGQLEMCRLGQPGAQRVGLVYLCEGEVPVRFTESEGMTLTLKPQNSVTDNP